MSSEVLVAVTELTTAVFCCPLLQLFSNSNKLASDKVDCKNWRVFAAIYLYLGCFAKIHIHCCTTLGSRHLQLQSIDM